MVIDCSKIASNLKNKVLTRIKNLKEKSNIIPTIAFVVTSNNISGLKFLNKKIEMAYELGVKVKLYKDIQNEKELFKIIEQLNNDNNIHGIVVQLPIFASSCKKTVFSMINSHKDIDGLNPKSIGNHILDVNQNINTPCTIKSVINILDDLKIDYAGKHAVIINRSHIVGKPLVHDLLNKNMTVTICHSHTKNIDSVLKNADLIVSGCNVPNIVNKSNVKRSSILINIGTNYIDNKIVGDIDFNNLKDYVDYITPIIGGVGPLTVLNVFDNLINLIERYLFAN